MRQFILRENVLSDNVLMVADEGKVFRNGYVAILSEHVFANAWSDKQRVKRFRNEDRLKSYLIKNYSEEELSDLDFICTSQN